MAKQASTESVEKVRLGFAWIDSERMENIFKK